MLILPPGHAQEAARPPAPARRERWMIAVSGAVVAALVVAVAIALTSRQRTSAHGCIDVSAATVIGGSELYRCGGAARALCSAPGGAHSGNVAFMRALADACRRARLPVPAAPRLP